MDRKKERKKEGTKEKQKEEKERQKDRQTDIKNDSVYQMDKQKNKLASENISVIKCRICP